MAYRNVYFHQLHLYKRELIKDKKTADTFHKDYKEINVLDQKVQYIINNHLNEHNCIRTKNSNETLEYLRQDDEYIFARLGKTKDIRIYHLRDRQTLKADPIQKNHTQELEVFTYVLINRKTYVISYLQEQSSPSIQILGDLISEIFYEEELFGEINSITVEDALPILSRKDRIGTISYRVSLPPEGSEYFNEEVTGLSEKEYDLLSNQKSIEFEIKLVAELNKDAFEEERENFVQIIKKIAKKAKSVKVKAKDDGEYQQEYNIVDSPFTKKTKFELESTDLEEMHKEIFTKLKMIYISEEKQIKKLCRI